MNELRFRQVHLDFHTSPAIENVGGRFDEKQFQDALKAGHVNSINCFAKCHHGFSYHDTKVGRRHPHLKTALLRRQIDAAAKIGVAVPIYVSVGLDNAIAAERPHWREISPDGSYAGWAKSPLAPGFHKMCLNGPYLEYVCEQIREVATMFPDGAGFWLDIIHQGQCCCNWCLEGMRKAGLDPALEADRQEFARRTLKRYYEEATAACRVKDPGKPVFHNKGHITRGDREILAHFSHLELESLPTGGWGYDHFPLSAKYCATLGMEFLGMTGKFHTSWGEFGGFKHPNALRYECAAMLAMGAKCNVGDQLHPEGVMDMSTYNLIGEAYAEVQAKEEWCAGAVSVAEVGLLSAAALTGEGGMHQDSPSDAGAARMLLESHVLFNVLDGEADFSPYRALILPDTVRIGPSLKKKLDGYLAAGGKLFLTGESGLDQEGRPVFDCGAQDFGESEYSPDFILPAEDIRPGWLNSPFVMYEKSRRLKVDSGESLGEIYDPYFNRTWEHFCSHQHAPARPEASGFACGVIKGNVMRLAHPVFKLYRSMGAVAYRAYAMAALGKLLGSFMLNSDLPSSARVSLTRQDAHGRYVLHLLHANPALRGKGIEVIEDLQPLPQSRIALRLDRRLGRALLEPEGKELPLERTDREDWLSAPGFTCHQIISLEQK